MRAVDCYSKIFLIGHRNSPEELSIALRRLAYKRYTQFQPLRLDKFTVTLWFGLNNHASHPFCYPVVFSPL